MVYITTRQYCFSCNINTHESEEIHMLNFENVKIEEWRCGGTLRCATTGG